MEEKLAIKENAVALLDKQLSNRAKKGQYGIIVLSSATDPYLHFEKDYQLTRQLLEVILKYRFPVHIITKSDLVVRDFDLLKQIEQAAILPNDLTPAPSQKVFVTFSFSTVDDTIGNIFEPGATAPSIRLETLKHAVNEGFLSGVSMMPLLPYITDTTDSLELMFGKFKEAGAKYVFPATITLFGDGQSDSKTLVLRAVEKHYPHLLEKYTKLFANSTQLPDYYNDAFYQKSAELCNRYGIPNRIK
jgi:DNA repair photolyase